jgi:transcriptional regulator with XRE-family HTH domain
MLSSRLKTLRERSGLTQGELSKKLGMARTTYSGYENGFRNPDPETLKKIADFYEVSIDYILGRNTINDQARNDAIEAYYRLPPSKKKLVDDIIKQLLDDKK